MIDMLDAGSAWLEGQRKSFLAKTVNYQRGVNSVALAATVGKTLFAIDDGNGAIINYESRDFLILAADLILNTFVVLPQRADLITEMVGSSTFTYEVCAPGKEPDWRYSDSYRRSLRIHTKLIGST